jgi:GNAT superfamily N-acetyltransferase
MIGGHAMNLEISVRASVTADGPAVEKILVDSWGEPRAAANGRLYDLLTLPTMVAVRPIAGGEEIVGVVTYEMVGDDIEVVSIDSTEPHRGVGTALLDAVATLGVANGMHTLWLITTNDNLDGLRFYQRRGLRIVSVRPGEVNASRALKPSIPRIGAYGIPIRDEIVLGRILPSGAEL